VLGGWLLLLDVSKKLVQVAYGSSCASPTSPSAGPDPGPRNAFGPTNGPNDQTDPLKLDDHRPS
jgi:hypothetical protein